MAIPTYTDNEVPIGSRVEALKRGVGAGTAVGSYIFENITLNRPGKVVERPNEIGGENGWALVNGFRVGTGVLQIAKAATEVPKLGDWFKDAFDGSTTAQEQWVLTDMGQLFDMNSYFKCNVSIRLSINPPTA